MAPWDGLGLLPSAPEDGPGLLPLSPWDLAPSEALWTCLMLQSLRKEEGGVGHVL